MGVVVAALVKNNIYIYIYIMSIIGAANNIGHKLIKEVEIEIGGQKIDKQYSEWLDIWNDLTIPPEKTNGYQNMVSIDNGTESGVTITKTLYIPLQFWFCRNPGLALPLIALQYHEVKINIIFEDNENCLEQTSTTATNPSGATAEIISMENTSLWVDYIYLDTDERRRFAQTSHEYLIDQLQFSGPIEGKGTTTGLNNQIALNYNHPVKELIWVNKDSSTSTWNTWSGVKNCNLKLNGHDRMAPRDGSYFSLVQPYQHHTNVPCNSNNTSKNINVYSFALKPEDHQPSGTCNMSRIDNTVLNVETTEANSIIRVYSINYNVLRIMGGMGGLAYSN